MPEFRIQIKLLSEAIFNSGEKEANLVQSRVLSDKDGFVFMHAKTFKGILKERAFWILRQYVQIDMQRAEQFLQSVHELFGLNHWELDMLEAECNNLAPRQGEVIGEMIRSFRGKTLEPAHMRLGHLELPAKAREYFLKLYQEQVSDGDSYIYLSHHDLIAAQTHVRVNLQLENGIAKKGMFNSTHTVRKGLIFHAPVRMEYSPQQVVLDDLARIVYATKRIGAGIHRGNGEVESRLLTYRDANDSQGGGEWVEEISSH